ncbi:MAG: TolC family protein [Rickettsiales bacterium]|nr:TolC family protein [Rickettsiales bacterium]
MRINLGTTQAATDYGHARDVEKTEVEKVSGGKVKEGAISIDLTRLVELVEKNNASVAVARLAALAHGSEAAASFHSFLPSVGIGAEYSRHRGKTSSTIIDADGNRIQNTGWHHYNTDPHRNVSVNVNYNLFNSGRDVLSVRGRRYVADAAKYTETAALQNTIYEAVTLYFYILLLEAQREALLEEQTARAEMRAIEESKQKLGITNPSDKLKVQNSYLEAKISVFDLDKSLKKERMKLNNFIGLAPDRDFIIVEKPAGKRQKTGISDVERRIEEALASDIRLKKLEEEKKLAKNNLLSAKLAMAPVVEAALSGAFVFKKNPTEEFEPIGSERMERETTSVEGGLSVRMNFPVFAGFQNFNLLKARYREVESLDAQLEAQKRDIKSNVIATVSDINYYIEVLPSLEESLKLQKSIFIGVLNSYRNGGSTMADVLLARSGLEKTKIGLLKEKYNLLARRLELLKLTGKLNTKNIINLGGFFYE